MANKKIDDILNSDLINQLIKQEDKDLKAAGWTYSEVKDMANFITNKSNKK